MDDFFPELVWLVICQSRGQDAGTDGGDGAAKEEHQEPAGACSAVLQPYYPCSCRCFGVSHPRASELRDRPMTAPHASSQPRCCDDHTCPTAAQVGRSRAWEDPLDEESELEGPGLAHSCHENIRLPSDLPLVARRRPSDLGPCSPPGSIDPDGSSYITGDLG